MAIIPPRCPAFLQHLSLYRASFLARIPVYKPSVFLVDQARLTQVVAVSYSAPHLYHLLKDLENETGYRLSPEEGVVLDVLRPRRQTCNSFNVPTSARLVLTLHPFPTLKCWMKVVYLICKNGIYLIGNPRGAVQERTDKHVDNVAYCFLLSHIHLYQSMWNSTPYSANTLFISSIPSSVLSGTHSSSASGLPSS